MRHAAQTGEIISQHKLLVETTEGRKQFEMIRLRSEDIIETDSKM